MVPSTSWVIFSYHVASEPSTLRVRSWRILRRIGALSLQQSVYVVPCTPTVMRKLEQLRDLIDEGGGETEWLDVEHFSEETARRLVTRFNEERSAEYEEFVHACFELSQNLETTPELQAEITRLQKWLHKIQMRDYFGCPQAETAKLQFGRIEERWLSTANER